MDKDGTALTGTPTRDGAIELSGAEMVIRALKDQGVKHIFGYPGGAVLPIYDALFAAEGITHVLCRHEQGAAHAAEGYARSTGKPGVVLVTSGPGATNAVTGLTDALMDSIPLVVLTGQVATHLIGTDAFQEADTVGITRACTKHNWLVKDVNELAKTMHEAFQIATTGRPGPVVVDIPKDVQFRKGPYVGPNAVRHRTWILKVDPDLGSIVRAIDLMANAKRPLFYTGGGIVNSGPEASRLLREFVKLTGFPITSTLMGLGAFPASDPQWLGLVGMHGTYESNHAMHDCDVMICLGARFDDRVTGNIAKFSPDSRKIHLDIDPAQINKNVRVEVPIVADATKALKEMLHFWKTQKRKPDAVVLKEWWKQIDHWRERKSLDFKNSATLIKPQYAIDRLYELPKRRGNDVYIAGEASVQMTMQEMSTAVQYNLPIKIFILNNEYMGMVRQWQQLLHGGRYSHSYSEALPDFVKMAEAFGCLGLSASKPSELDAKIQEMIDSPKAVLFDCRVDATENCYPMIPSGAAHNEMILSALSDASVSDEGKMLV